MDKLSNLENLQVLHFQLAHLYACVNVKFIQRLLPLMWIEDIPSAPAHIVGFMNVAGKIVPVMDLAWYLKISSKEKYSLDAHILLFEIDQKSAGIIVEKVVGLENISKNKIQEPTKIDLEHPIFVATIKFDYRLSWLIDPEQIIRLSPL